MPATKLSEKALMLITTARGLMRQDTLYGEVSSNAKVKLIIQMNAILKDKNNRKSVLRAITGLPISTQKNLTHHTTCVLIGLTLEDAQNEDAIREIENFTEEYSKDPVGDGPEDIIKDWLQSDMCRLPETDIPF